MYVWLPPAINKMMIYGKETGNAEGTYCGILQYRKEKLTSSFHRHLHHVNAINTYHMVNKTATTIAKEGSVQLEVCNDDVDTSVYFIYLIIGIALTLAWIVVTIVNKFVDSKKYLISKSFCNFSLEKIQFLNFQFKVHYFELNF